ncbi:MAG: hypothetical protein JWO45_351, partial [Spartobacteria bacterium]|nr:hypothetical protein [Spartobacteria bacterium]
ARVQVGWRCLFRAGCTEDVGDYTGAGRRRPHDDRDADGEHGEGGEAKPVEALVPSACLWVRRLIQPPLKYEIAARFGLASRSESTIHLIALPGNFRGE